MMTVPQPPDILDRNADPEQLVTSWNQFRSQNPDFIPNFTKADLRHLRLPQIDFSNANLSGADLFGADLSGANLSEATLIDTKFLDSNLSNTDFESAYCGSTLFVDVDLSLAKGLKQIYHAAPSMIDFQTLECCNGNIPEKFLRGCGLTPWEVLSARLYDPSLRPSEIAKIQQRMYDERTKGYFLSGIFISYSRKDDSFVQMLYKRLVEEGANVWRDTEDLVAGPTEKQVQHAIRVNDVVLLVLSQDSVDSDWVEAELDWARDKEKQMDREVLCPIALDDSWKEKSANSVLWRKVTDKNILDFSKWEDGGFNTPFGKLLEGIKRWYGA